MRLLSGLFSLTFFLSSTFAAFSQVAIGTGATAPNLDTSAVLLLEGNGSQGIIIPKVSSLGSFGKPGMVVYNTATGTVYYFSTKWVELGTGGSAAQGIQISGNKVSIGTGAGFTPDFSIAAVAPGANGQILMWDTSLNSGAGGWTSSATTAPSAVGQVLKWNGSRWEPGTDNTGSTTTLSGDVSGPSNNSTISITAGNSIAAALNNAATTSKILPAQISAGAAGQVLTTTSGVAVWATPAGSALPSLSANQILSNNGTNTAINVAGDIGLSVSGTTGTFTVANNAITSPKLANNAVDATKIANGAVGLIQLANGPANNVLTTNASGVPTWAAGGGSGITSLNISSSGGVNYLSSAVAGNNATITTNAIVNNDISTTANISGTKLQDGTLPVSKIASGSASNNQVLQFNSGSWAPATLPGAVTGNLTTSTTGLTITGGTNAVNGTGATINIQNASTSQGGLLTQTDWNTFNSKLSAASIAGGELSGTLSSLTINSNAITTAKINNGAVTIAKIGTAGVPDANKVLTTDASGVPQWTVAAGGGDMLKSTYDPTNINGSAFNLSNHTGQVGATQIADASITGGTTGPGVKIAANTITDANISSTAAIAGTKIAPAFGTQNITTTTGSASIGGGLNVGLANGFTINNSGNITKINGATTSFPAANAVGVLTNDGAGTLSWAPAGGGSVSTVSVVNANGFNGSVANATSTPAITIGTSLTGLLKGTGAGISSAAAGTDYQAPITLTTTGTSGAATLVGNTLNVPNYSSTAYLAGTGLTLTTNTFSVNTSQNISTLSNLTTNGLIKTSGGTGALSIATAGTDYLTPTGNGSGLTNLNASNISSGTLPVAQVPNLDAAKITTGSFASTQITDGTIVDADVNASAAIAGSKINPNFGTQNISTTGTLTTGTAGAFAVNATGNITKINNVTTSFPAGNAAGVLTNNGAGILTWAAGGSGWGLTGNTGTVDGTNFIGTTDDIPLNFKVNGQKAGRIDHLISSTFFGYQAGNFNTTGAHNTATGRQALYSNTTGDVNTATGTSALYSNTTGVANTATGGSALLSNTVGFNNTANGAQVLLSNTIGAENTANGYTALYSNTSGNRNAAFGDQAGRFNTIGSYNTANGSLALFANTTGSYNTAIGYTALMSNNTGSNNTAIGYQADVTTDALTNATAIGYNAKVATSNSLALGGTGVDAVNVGIGTTSPTQRLDVVGNVKFSGALMPNNTAGTAGQVLTSAGPGAAPTWSPAGGSGWGLTGTAGTVDGTNFIGTTDNIPFTIRVNNQQAMRISFTGATSAPNILAGYSGNTISNGVVGSAILSGGLGGQINQVTDNYSVVGGGSLNSAGNNDADPGNAGAATVSGGNFNKASSSFATVGGGYNNQASGNSAVVAGGRNATASGEAAGVLSGEVNQATGFRSAVVGGNASTASGANSFVGGGEFNGASGNFSAVSGGGNNLASGDMTSIPGGRGLFARSFGETAVGIFNIDYTPTSTTSFTASDRLFVIGNGTDFSSRSNALTVLKNGNVGIGTTTPISKLNVSLGQWDLVNSEGDFSIGDGTHRLKMGVSGGGGGAGDAYIASQGGTNRLFLGNSNSLANSQTLTLVGGNVGIGTSAPTNRLHINEPSTAGNFLRITNNPSPNGLSIGLSGAGSREAFIANNENAAMYFQTNASNRLAITAVGNVGIGTILPNAQLQFANVTGNRKLVLWESANNDHEYYGFGVNGGEFRYQIPNNTGSQHRFYAATGTTSSLLQMSIGANGNVAIAGNLSKGSGTFKIDHPQDPENKYLYHSFVESPDMMNVYNGNITTDVDGNATVKLPAYFESLNKDFRYQLTVIGAFAQAIVASEVNENKFVIKTDKPNIKVSWQVTGIRKDPYAEQNRVVPEMEKPAKEKGKYLHPEAYGLPLDRSVNHVSDKKENN